MLLAGIFFVAISNLFGVYPAKLIRIAVDEVFNQIDLYKKGADISMDEVSKQLLYFFGLIALVTVLKGIFMFFMRQTIIVISRRIEFDLKNEIYHHYQNLHLGFFRKNNTGDMMNRITEDVSRVRMYVGPCLMYMVNLVVMILIVVITMLSINVKLTLYAISPLPLLALSIFYVNGLIHHRSEKIQEKLSDLSTFVQETFSGIRIIKSFVREETVYNVFKKQSNQYKVQSLKLAVIQALFFPIMMFLIGLSIILTVYVGGIETIKGNISPGNIAEFVVYVNMLTWPVTALGWVSSLTQRAAASQKRINEFLYTQSDLEDTGSLENPIEGRLAFENVSFTYPDTGIEALKNINLSIKAGKTIGITGKTGSGKSTLALLCSRFYDPSSGTITIDDKALQEYRLSHVRSNIVVVPQNVFLFSDTIANNISFANRTLTEADWIELAKQADVHQNILDFKEGYQTRIGERGISLSGGQKQRISIARSLAVDAPIYIFDDCLSAVDTKTEENILRALLKTTKQKTSLIISHRVSTLKHCDEIIVLDEGRIVEQGSHQQLLERQAYYAQIYQKQLSEKEEIPLD
jgi:ATP-binding cassette, subfamily B, multidrug efflux pump